MLWHHIYVAAVGSVYCGGKLELGTKSPEGCVAGGIVRMCDGEYRINTAVAGDLAKLHIELVHDIIAAEIRVNHAPSDFCHIC